MNRLIWRARTRTALGVCIAAALTATACGGDDDESSDDGGGATVVVTETPVEGPRSGTDATRSEPGDVDARTGVDVEYAAEAADAATRGATGAVASDIVPVEPPIQPPVEPPVEPPVDQPVTPPAGNPVVDTATDPLSTFAIDVDTGSYTLARAYLTNGTVPDPAAVRTEEFVNYFDQDYAQPTDGAFAVTMDGTSAPFLPGDQRIVRVGVQGRSVDQSERRDANLTFVVDVSGSMADPGKLDAIRPALVQLVESLRPTDRVSIVVYEDTTRTVLTSTPVSERDAILSAIDQLQPGGSTFAEAGLRLGYDEARASLDAERINRVVLLSDGVANVGETGPDAILATIGDAARDGIGLVTVGFGMGSFNDHLMEQLADKGDGFYAYVDGEREVTRLFTEDLTGTLVTIGREAKIQVAFDPSVVTSYRLIGFENRAVADEDFRDDTVDGGEIGAGHNVTALYEVTLAEGAADAPLATTTLRWLDPDSDTPTEITASLTPADLADNLGQAAVRLQQDVYVAGFAELLRGGPWGTLVSLDGLAQNVESLAGQTGDPALSELAGLIDARIQLG